MQYSFIRRPEVAPRFRGAILCVPILLLALLLDFYPGSAARAQTAPSTLPHPRTLALPAAAFPRGSTVQGAPVISRVATQATGLHTTGLAALGRIAGFEQTAGWNLPSQGAPFYRATLRYEAGFFAAGGAANAAADARASLWELGKPLSVSGVPGPVFQLHLHGGTTELAAVLSTGSIEAELIVRYSSRVPGTDAQTALRQLTRLGGAAASVIGHLAPSLPPVTTSPGQPSVFVAPPGAGPVVKSPSLMVLDAASAADLTLHDGGGAFRPSSPPPLAASATPTVALVPAGQLSRYVALSQIRTRDDLFDSAAVFDRPAAARSAYENLVRSNHVLHLSTAPPAPAVPVLPHLNAADASHVWRSGNETVMAVLWQNVVLVLAQRGPDNATLPATAERALLTVPSWLHAQGTQIVDVTGSPVHLAGLNWYGSEQQDFVVGGLDYESYESILWSIKHAGYNTIRLPFSDQLVEQDPAVTAHLRANPDLIGMHALEILDRIISYAGALGLSVILDNHRSDAGWSSQENGLWYTPEYPESAFDRDWETMAGRYAATTTVVGADLRNEPHGVAQWGNGDPATDWKMAAEKAGNVALAANPHLLIMVEGVQYYGTAPSYWWGGNLMGVATAPVNLRFPSGASAHSQLVYSTHDYGVDNCSSGCPWFNASTTYASLSAVWTQYWGYITADPTRPYAAPVWVGEFGTCNYNPGCVAGSTPGSQGQWFQSLVQYIGSNHLSWTYWSANGTQSTAGTRTYGTLDWYGYFQQDWVVPVPWLTAALQSIQTDTGGPAAPTGSAG